MTTSGIIAEFNPLHKGHEFLISEAKKDGAVICVLSSNFVQRGEVAIAEKSVRANAALKAGCDLVLELPVCWSMSTAQNFALGGVSALHFAGCDRIVFGSESGNTDELLNAAELLNSEAFSLALSKELGCGVTFAAARETAGAALGIDPQLLSNPNNNLGIEYMIAANKLGSNISFDTVKRVGAAHDSLEENTFVSATLLRKALRSGDMATCEKYMPDNISKLFSADNISDPSLLERAILATLRQRTAEELSRLPDISEGLENKLYSAISSASSLDELLDQLKVKRYTLARLRRLVLSAFLGLDSSLFMKPIPYLRVLGFNKTGEALLRDKLSKSPVPVITRSSDVKSLNPDGLHIFETEAKATDLFALSLEKPFACGLEYTRKLIKTEL